MKYNEMKDKGKRELMSGLVLLAGFIVWTVLIRHIDVQRAGPGGTEIGFASFNVWFHRMTGVHMARPSPDLYMYGLWASGSCPVDKTEKSAKS